LGLPSGGGTGKSEEEGPQCFCPGRGGPLVRTVVEVRQVVRETPSTVTLRFAYGARARPGQFVMVWFPGDDEIPMSLSYTEDGDLKGVTIKAMGRTSRRALDLRVGDPLGIRGPYGHPFDLSPQRILVISGGSGGAVLAPAAEAAARSGSLVTVANGATTAPELLFEDRFRRIARGGYFPATDDGSRGEHGFVTQVADRVLAEGSFDAIWTCGPEKMMKKVLALGDRHGVPAFFSLERHMKCALGICDACAFGPYHVCQDGPIFPSAVVRQVPDFGEFKRGPAGTVERF
jgi:dihydroorotate dehydrogenase electron transfer subunit